MLVEIPWVGAILEEMCQPTAEYSDYAALQCGCTPFAAMRGGNVACSQITLGSLATV